VEEEEKEVVEVVVVVEEKEVVEVVVVVEEKVEEEEEVEEEVEEAAVGRKTSSFSRTSGNSSKRFTRTRWRVLRRRVKGRSSILSPQTLGTRA
jgi:hypothetical protein